MSKAIHVLEIIKVGIQNNIKQYSSNQQLKEVTNQLWEIIDESFQAAQNVLATIPVDKLNDRDKTVLFIACNCLSDYVGGVDALLRGFHRPSATIFRGCVENLALAIAIEYEQEVYDQYVAGKYHIPSAVTAAKKFLPEIGKLYGILTQKFVHEPHESVGRAIRQSGDVVEFMLIPPIDSNELLVQLVLLNSAAMNALIIGEVFEWTFGEYLNQMTYWEKVGDGNLKGKPSRGKQVGLEIGKILEKRLQESSK